MDAAIRRGRVTKWRPVLLAIGLLFLGMLYVRACWEPSIRADERRRAGDRSDDSAIARLAARELEREKAFSRERDSTGRVIANLRSRIAPRDSVRLTDTSRYIYQLAVRDTLIAAQASALSRDSLQLLFWKAQNDTMLRTIVPNLVTARDSWRREASKPRHTLTDILGGTALGYAVAKENEVAAATGGALIVLPRVLDLLGISF